MAYTKQLWINNDPVFGLADETRMTHIEQGIFDAHALAGSGGYTPPNIVIAASNSDSAVRASTPFVCGTNNAQSVINDALHYCAALVSNKSDSPAGAKQLGWAFLAPGDYNCTSQILVPTGVRFSGTFLSHLKTNNCNSPGLIGILNVNDRLVEIDHLWLDGTGGGTCNGIDVDSTGSDTSIGGYLVTNNDSYQWIHHLFIRGFSNRRAILMHGGGDGRASMVHNIQVRDSGPTGAGGSIEFNGHSDSQLSHCHVGNAPGYAYYFNTGNMMGGYLKSFFTDGWGFRFESGRHQFTTLQSQDDVNGIYIGAADFVGSAFAVDSAQTTSLQVAATGVQLEPFTIFNRGGSIRFTTTSTGLLVGGQTDLTLNGRVNPSGITTKVSGTLGARSDWSYSDGTTRIKGSS